MADQVLYMGVRGVTDLMMVHGLVNLDFADIRAVMAEMGKAMMGTGESEGENRAIRAAEAAINNPLLEDTSMSGARGLLINITGGEDLTLFEVDQAANRIREEVNEDANVIFGSAVDESLAGRIRVSVVATGIDSHKSADNSRPKLVAVGGGVAPAPIAVRNAPSSRPAQPVTPSQPAPMASRPRQPSPQQERVSAPPSGSEAPAVPVGLHARPNTVPPYTMPEHARPSLFNMVTGVLRHRPIGPAASVQPSIRREPEVSDYQPLPPVAPVRQTAVGDETGLEIPAFLRRQSLGT